MSTAHDHLEKAQRIALRATRRASRPVQKGRMRRCRRACRRASVALSARNVSRARRNVERAASFASAAEANGLTNLGRLHAHLGSALESIDRQPQWSWQERLSVNADFLRTGRTQDQIDRGKYSLTMAYGVQSPGDRKRLLDAHLEAGRTGYPFSVQDGPYRLWDLEQAFVLRPDEVAEACEEIIEAGLIPIPQLLTQHQIADSTLDELEDWMRPHAETWGHLAGLLWLTFEHNESVHPASQKEGMRGDDWISALAGRADALFEVEDLPILLHQTAGEHHDHRSWAAGGKAGESPTSRAVLAFQFHSWNPKADAIVTYKNDDGTAEQITSEEAHRRDWSHMLGHHYPTLAWEYGQSIGNRVEWSDELVWHVGSFLSEMADDVGRPDGVGCGGE